MRRSKKYMMRSKKRYTKKKRHYKKRAIQKGGELGKAEIHRIASNILGSGYEQMTDCNAYLCYKYVGSKIVPSRSRGFFSSSNKIAPATTMDLVSELNYELNRYNFRAEGGVLGGVGYVIQIVPSKV